jgi:hypothetical protein
VLLLGSGLAWAGPPNPTQSDVDGNTAGGTNALINIITGSVNTGFGIGALYSDKTGDGNTAFGTSTLFWNTTGEYNTASGFEALTLNRTGQRNTASGSQALNLNAAGNYNTAGGAWALFNNYSGSYNTADGFQALFSNVDNLYNTASGAFALLLTTGGGNTGIGMEAGLLNTTGNVNTFIGFEADANAGGYKNGTAIGAFAKLTASNSIVIGNNAISTIYANVTSITAISDRRRKKDTRALDADLGLDFIEKLKPVSYRFNNGDETERYGFIAQDLEQALPVSLHDTIERSEPEHGLALIERQNDKDRTYRVSYGELFAPIVKAIQQQQQEIEAVRQQNADLRHALEDQTGAFKAENDALRHTIAALREQVSAAR